MQGDSSMIGNIGGCIPIFDKYKVWSMANNLEVAKISN